MKSIGKITKRLINKGSRSSPGTSCQSNNSFYNLSISEVEKICNFICENNGCYFSLVSAEGHIIFAGSSFKDLGYDKDSLSGRLIFDFIHPDESADFSSLIIKSRPSANNQESASSGEITSRDFRFLSHSGEWIKFKTSVIPVIDSAEADLLWMIVFQNITTNKPAEEDNIRLAAIPRESPNPILSCDSQGNITYINPAAKTILNDLGIKRAEYFLPKNHLQIVQSCLDDRKSYNQIEADISGHFFSWSYNPIPDIKIVHIHGMDITEQKYVEQKLIHDALHDSLTGLPNRIMFRDTLERSIKRARRKKDYNFAVLFLDLTRFKLINDSLGHLIGDKVLIKTAERLTACLRPGDLAARFGGDEFTIFLDDIEDSSDAIRVAKRVQTELSAHLIIENQEIIPSAGIGIVLYSKDYSKPEDLLRDANTAMFKAKSHGGSNYVMFDKEMHLHAMKLLQLETDLQHAIERREFRVYYQPIIALSTGKLSGFEALLRWERPGYGLMPPDSFISFLEETDMILPVGEWVLKEACGQLKKWQNEFPDKNHLTVSVNLSARQFSQPDLIDKVRESLQQNNLYASSLKLEITESVIMENYSLTNSLLMQLRQMNVQLSIDDFGTGYSSLSQLYRFPIHILKIDRSFINIIRKNGENSEIAQTIISLARNLGITVIAEGIENEDQMIVLKNMNCEYGQGYYISRPLTSDAATEFLRENHRW